MNIRHRALTFGAALLLCAATTGGSLAGEPTTYSSLVFPQSASAEPANLQLPVDTQQVESLPLGTVRADRGVAPLLDDGGNQHQIVIGEELLDSDEQARRGVRPYGGGHPGDWPWGCGGSPFRTGPGPCDTWRVGCRWDVTVDGMTMRREGTNIWAIWNETDEGQLLPEILEDFSYAPGGRVSLIGKYPWCAGYQVQAAYEGIEKWEASIVYPKLTLDEDAGLTERRQVHYTSDLHSAELNILRCCFTDPIWRPFCGVRYFKFDDQLRDVIDQDAPAPFPSTPSTSVTTTDQLNLFNLKNQLMGFQIGLRHDYWKVNNRFAIEGFVNGGVYYNKIKYTNWMNTTSLLQVGDDSSTGDTDETGQVGSFSNNVAAADLSDISYSWEASLSAVCRLNKCWAMRAGYQVLWINNLRLADDAFLDPDNFTDNESHSLLFQGWHAGIECRR